MSVPGSFVRYVTYKHVLLSPVMRMCLASFCPQCMKANTSKWPAAVIIAPQYRSTVVSLQTLISRFSFHIT